MQLGLITFSQVGLPRMIKEWQSDPQEQRNLLDEDFGKDMVD